MEERFVTSEEKLLNVIRKQDKLRVQAKAKSQSSSGATGFKKDSTIAFLKVCNHLFLLASICFFGFIVFKYFQLQGTQSNGLQVEVKNDPNAENISSAFIAPQELFNPLPEVMVTRDIFEAPWEKPQTATPQNAAAMVAGGSLSSVIRVSGIILDSVNPQVIVEDLVNGETAFLSKGQEFKGATLVEVKENKALFLYQNQNIELAP